MPKFWHGFYGPQTDQQFSLNGVYDEEERKLHAWMKIAPHPPPPLPSSSYSFLGHIWPCFLSSFPLGSSLKITLPPTLTHFQLPSWQCFRFGSHRSLPPSPFCLLSMTHCTLGYFSPQAQIKQLCSLALHPPASAIIPHIHAHICAHEYQDEWNVNECTSDRLQKPTAQWKTVLICTRSNYWSCCHF